MTSERPNPRCGYVAIVGRPNVGKSTLLNHILGQKLSITSKKPQTTRHRLLGIKTSETAQLMYVDTPGIHRQQKRAINRYMNRSAKSVIRGVDVIVFVTDRTQWHPDDQVVLDSLKRAPGQVIVAINKVDLLKDKKSLLPHIEKLQELIPMVDIVPISANTGDNVESLEELVEKKLPYGSFLYDDDQVTDRSERFLVSEIIIIISHPVIPAPR